MFQWHSQNRTKRETPTGQQIKHHQSEGIDVHLLIRDRKKLPNGTGAPFIYCGGVEFVEWEGDQPITVRWKLINPLLDQLIRRFRVDDSITSN